MSTMVGKQEQMSRMMASHCWQRTGRVHWRCVGPVAVITETRP
jgi:hypothetical protein